MVEKIQRNRWQQKHQCRSIVVGNTRVEQIFHGPENNYKHCQNECKACLGASVSLVHLCLTHFFLVVSFCNVHLFISTFCGVSFLCFPLHKQTQHFFLTEAQFQSFAQSDLIGMTRMSPALSSDPNAIVTFLTVLLERIWLLQKRLNLIQQHALTAIFDERLQDINYNFSVDVRTKQAMQPDRKQKVVRDAVHDRVKPRDIEWRFVDGKWIMVDQETFVG